MILARNYEECTTFPCRELRLLYGLGCPRLPIKNLRGSIVRHSSGRAEIFYDVLFNDL